jgi:hypothetical protein
MRACVVVVALASCHPNDHWDRPADGGTKDGRPTTHVPDAAVGPPDAYFPTSMVGCVPAATSHDTGILPIAPTVPASFMWPSLQESFHRPDGSTCTGRVTVAANDRAVCYVGVDNDLHCAGAIYSHTYGPGFVGLGRYGVDQIMIFPTFNSPIGNSICTHERAGTVHCMGQNTFYGAFGTGTTDSSDTFVQWSTLTTLARFGGTIDIRCALDTTGKIYCAGYGIGAAATRQDTGAGGHASFWVTSFGALEIDDPTVFRAANVSPCEVQADGLHCMSPGSPPISGTPGTVVDGTITASGGMPEQGATCWLDSLGRVFCSVGGGMLPGSPPPVTAQRFACAPPMLALAGSFYADAQCAVSNDGALWCSGSNSHGELGITGPAPDDVQVQPPGSVKIECD